MNLILPPLKCSFLKHLWDLIGVGKITKKSVRKEITLTVVKNSPGTKTNLLNGEQAEIVATS